MSNEKTEAKCPFPPNAGGGTSNRDWWPKPIAAACPAPAFDPVRSMGEGFHYAERVHKASISRL